MVLAFSLLGVIYFVRSISDEIIENKEYTVKQYKLDREIVSDVPSMLWVD